MIFPVHFPPSHLPILGDTSRSAQGGRIPSEFNASSCWLPVCDRLRGKSSSLQEQGGFRGSEQLQQLWRNLHPPVSDLASSTQTGVPVVSCTSLVTDCWGFGPTSHGDKGRERGRSHEPAEDVSAVLRGETETRIRGTAGSERSQPGADHQEGLWGGPGALLGLQEGFWICGNSGEVMATSMSSWLIGIIPPGRMGVTAANEPLC